MSNNEMLCMYLADSIALISTTAAFIYGVKNFFKKGKAFYLQIVTMAMGCYAMGSFYHLCQSLTFEDVIEGFTAAYLGKIGFFLFLFTANFGQMDGLLDDRTAQMKKSRYIAFLAPLTVILLYIPCVVTEMPLSTKITFGLVWISALFSSYFNFKHAIIKDLGYGFVNAIRPYNISALVITFLELLLLVMWSNYDIKFMFLAIALTSGAFGIMCVVTMVLLKKGVEAWKI